ncbi:NADH-quinone oxidoreductase subunit M [Bdellovibrionota bacterium FG-2]
MNNHFLSLMIILPLAGAVLQMGISKKMALAGFARWGALISSIAASLVGVVLVFSMDRQTPDLQFTESLSWVGSYAIHYELGLDGLNALLVLLVSIIFPVLLAAEWNQKTGLRGMHGLFLILQCAFFGVAVAQDLFLLFFFWGLSAMPFYFLVGIWGGEGRESAAFRSVVASAIGNCFLFAALILVYYSADPHSFSIRDLSGGRFSGKSFFFFGREILVSSAAFVLMSLGLACRAPIWPLHGWFSNVAKEAPPTVFISLAAVTVPVAIYIFVRLSYSLFPEMLLGTGNVIVLVGAANLVMGGIFAVAQKGLRLLLAFLCLSGVGLALIGVGSLQSAGVVGAVFHLLVFGLGLCGFGLFAGVIASRSGHSMFLKEQRQRSFGGLATVTPMIAVVAGVFIASLLGIPGFGGFVGNALLIIGSYSVHPAMVIVAGLALLLSTYFLFTMYRCVFFGEPNTALENFSDLTLREKFYFLPLVAGLIFAGIYPKPLLELVRPTVLTLLSTIK